jgi:hypothetical protein
MGQQPRMMFADNNETPDSHEKSQLVSSSLSSSLSSIQQCQHTRMSGTNYPKQQQRQRLYQQPPTSAITSIRSPKPYVHRHGKENNILQYLV